MMKRMPWDKEPSHAPKTLSEHVACYIEQHRFALTPLRKNSKIPTLVDWQRRAATSIDEWNAMYLPEIHGGIGLVHSLARTGACDVDHLESMRLIFAEYGWDYNALFAAFPRTIGNPERDKIFFRLPVGFDPGQNGLGGKVVLRWPDPTGECDAGGNPRMITVFELRGGENQDVLPPSIHPETGNAYQWVDGQAPWDYDEIPTLPADHPLLLIWAQWDIFKDQLERISPLADRNARVVCGREYQIQPVQVAGISGSGSDVIGQFNRSVSVADMLERNGYKRKGKRWLAPHSSTRIPGVIALEGGKVFSHHGSDVLCNGHAHDAFSLLTSLEHGGSIDAAVSAAAQELGIPMGHAVPAVDFSALIANGNRKRDLKKRATQQKPEDPYVFPAHLLDVPGMVGEMADYINRSALFPQPVLALASSLSFCGAMMGRKVHTRSDLRTNIYTMGVADSGSGKEHARKAIKRIAVEANAAEYVGAEKLASDQGLFTLLADAPSCLALLDEFGRTLRVLGNERAPAHLQQLLTSLLELTGSADSYIIEKRRAEHSAGNPPRVIQNPNLCIYATTVPGRLYQNLTPDEVIDGFLPRWLIFESDTPDPEMSTSVQSAVPGSLIDAVAQWAARSTAPTREGNLIDVASVAVVEPALVPTEMDADTVLDEHAKRWRARKQASRGTGMDALWARAYEHALRLSLIRASGDSERISRSDALWACELVEFLLSRTASQAAENIASNDHESDVQKMQRFISERGETTLRDISRKFRGLKQKERDGIIGGLLDAELVETKITKGNNRPSVIIRWTGNSE